MICESCKFENREGALFCAECGKPLASANADKPKENDENKTVIIDEVVTNSKESVDKEDESEANTTVLTSDMLKPAHAAAPQGFTAGPSPVKPMAPKMVAPQGAPVNGQPAPMNPQAPKMAAPQGAPVNGQPAPMNPQAPKMGMAPTAPAPVATAPEKPAKVDKKAAKAAKKENKGKMGTGTKVYIVISILLILAMGGALVYGYFYHKDKMDVANTEIDNLKASATDAEATIKEKETEITNLQASVTAAETTISGLDAQLTENQAALTEAQATADTYAGYAAYASLIEFVETSTGDASTDLMVSDTVIYTTVGSTVDLYVYFPSSQGKLNYKAENAQFLECEWGGDDEWINGNVLPLHINAIAAGDATIEITNDQNDITEKVYIHIQ